MGFIENTNIDPKFYAESVDASKRGSTCSIRDMYGIKAARACVNDARVHDANFAFLTTALAKLHKEIAEPLVYTTWQRDIPVETGGGFVDYVEFYSVDWAGIMNQYRNVVGNGVNYIPRVNAGLTQHTAKVYTYEVAYDLRFIELEKMKPLALQKSIQEIYNNAIVAGWDLFVQGVAYNGIAGGKGLFNSDKVLTGTIDNSSATGDCFEGMTDAEVVAFFNGMFNRYLTESNMNPAVVPDTILVPSKVMADITGRFSDMYTSNLYQFIIDHNLGKSQVPNMKLTIEGRADLDVANGGKGRIVAYRKNKQFVRIDVPYPMQHYITLPNIERMSYTTAFVGQVSEIQMPYNTNNTELGIVTYWDFTD